MSLQRDTFTLMTTGYCDGANFDLVTITILPAKTMVKG